MPQSGNAATDAVGLRRCQVLHHERRSRREYAALCGAPQADQQQPQGSWLRQAAFGAVATLVGASLCWQLLEAYEHFL